MLIQRVRVPAYVCMRVGVCMCVYERPSGCVFVPCVCIKCINKTRLKRRKEATLILFLSHMRKRPLTLPLLSGALL